MRQAEEAQQLWESGNLSQFYKAMRRTDPLGPRREARGLGLVLLSADGQLLRAPEAVLRRQTEWFSGLLVAGGEVSDCMLQLLSDLEAKVSEPCAPGQVPAASSPQLPQTPQQSQRPVTSDVTLKAGPAVQPFWMVSQGGQTRGTTRHRPNRHQPWVLMQSPRYQLLQYATNLIAPYAII